MVHQMVVEAPDFNQERDMSTKIYTGYLYTGQDILADLKKIRIQMIAALEDMLVRVTESVTPEKRLELAKLWKKELEEAPKRMSSGAVDFIDSSACVFSHKKKIYVMTFNIDERLTKVKLPRTFKDFAYWDNADPPEGMQKGAGYKKFQKRSEIWNEILGGHGYEPPEEAGLVFNFFSDRIRQRIFDRVFDKHIGSMAWLRLEHDLPKKD